MEIIEKIITENEDGKRLDAAVSMLNEKISRTLAQELIKNGTILLDGKPQKVSSKVRGGQVVTMPEEYNTKPNEDILPEDIDIDILYEDEDIIVVNKPKDMVVHPAVGNWTGTLVNAMLGKHDLSDENGEFRPGIVHRLDKNTTGVMVVAKNNNAHNLLASQIQAHDFKKIYVALVKGVIPENEAIIELPIGRHPTDRKKMAVVKDGRDAYTKFKVLERFDKYTFVEVELKTGRTHQIRVHMSHIGYPIVGDDTYSNGKNPFGVTSQMLHSKTLGIIHPTTKEYMEFEAPMPEEFESVLAKLRNNEF
ncbi:MAG: RluA family pseudouridine synthase [Clostridia bacterium]|nr:RluA family pseudouridine synthase [Clostridia bacterium]